MGERESTVGDERSVTYSSSQVSAGAAGKPRTLCRPSSLRAVATETEARLDVGGDQAKMAPNLYAHTLLLLTTLKTTIKKNRMQNENYFHEHFREYGDILQNESPPVRVIEFCELVLEFAFRVNVRVTPPKPPRPRCC